MRLSHLRDKLLTILFGLSVTCFVVIIQNSEVPFFSALMERLKLVTYDLQLKHTLPFSKDPMPPITIVDIDEKSLQALGRWPWSREILAKMSDSLHEAGAVVVGFDMIFSEPEKNEANEVLNYAHAHSLLENKGVDKKLIHEFDADAKFAKSLEPLDAVIGFIFHSEEALPVGVLPAPIQGLSSEQVQRLQIPTTKSYTGNLDLFQKAAPYAGFISTIRDEDGIIRRAPLLMRYDNKVYASLSLEVARRYLLVDEIDLEIERVGEQDQVQTIILDKAKIPTDAGGRVLVPFRGGARTFNYISASAILQQQFDKTKVKDHIILIGTSALGLGDLNSTAIESVFPGVEIHANVIAGIINGTIPYEPGWVVGVNMILTAASGIIPSLLGPFLGPFGVLLLGIVIVISLVVFNLLLWLHWGLLTTLVYPYALSVSLVIFYLGWGFVSETRRKKEVLSMFGQYVSPEHISEIGDDLEHYGFEGDTRPMTVLFADIRNFTYISEGLSASELKHLLNDYFGPMTRLIFATNGTIDKYIGDLIMAFWGAPLPTQTHALDAVKSALMMLAKTNELAPKWLEQGFPEIRIGIGINTGIMNVGDMGSEYRRSYTVLGDAVNLASRLESSTKYYRVQCLIGEATFEAVHEVIHCRVVDYVRVKGKKEGIRIYTPVCEQALLTEAEKLCSAAHDDAFTLYFSQEWILAKAAFGALVSSYPGIGLYELFYERVCDFVQTPPPAGWDGIYERLEK